MGIVPNEDLPQEVYNIYYNNFGQLKFFKIIVVSLFIFYNNHQGGAMRAIYCYGHDHFFATYFRTKGSKKIKLIITFTF